MSNKFSKRIRVQPAPHICRAPPLPPGIIPPWPPGALVASFGLLYQLAGKPTFNAQGSCALLKDPAANSYRGSVKSNGQRVDAIAWIEAGTNILRITLTGVRNGAPETIAFSVPTTLAPGVKHDTRDLDWGFESIQNMANARVWIAGRRPAAQA